MDEKSKMKIQRGDERKTTQINGLCMIDSELININTNTNNRVI